MNTVHLRAIGALVILVAASACTRDGAEVTQAPLNRITTDAALRRGVDPAKLDAVLAHVPEESRETLRAYFAKGKPIARLTATTPALQALLDEIYADETRLFVKKTRRASGAWTHPFMLALGDGPADLVRIVRGSSRKEDVVVISSGAADVAHLTAAIRVLDLARSRWDRDFTDDQVLEARIGNPSSQVPPSWAEFAEAQLARARTAVQREVAGVGRVRAVSVERPRSR